MKSSTAEAIVVLAYRAVWFLGQASLAYLLWNFAVAEAFGWPALSYIHAVATYAMTRLAIKPPKLTIKIN